MTEHRFKLSIGPFSFAIATDNATAADDIRRIYRDFKPGGSADYVDFDISLRTRSLLRRYFKPQVDFYLDERRPFKPLPRDQAYAMLEWGMNWCVANHAHQYLIIHAGVVEKNGHAIILPATQGAGKSTLTASLVYADWRLFSDELALISPADKQVYPYPRPINLKNESIDIIRSHIGGGVFSKPAFDTAKGTVSLLQPPHNSVLEMHKPAKPSAFVLPQYAKGHGAVLKRLAAPKAFEEIINHCFNYHILGLEGFELLYDLVSTRPCYTLTYSSFEQANAALSRLVET